MNIRVSNSSSVMQMLEKVIWARLMIVEAHIQRH
jgi:hypothetical protein